MPLETFSSSGKKHKLGSLRSDLFMLAQDIYVYKTAKTGELAHVYSDHL